MKNIKSTLKKNPNIVTREIGGETILLPIYKTSDEINCIYTLNQAASRVWKLIDGRRTLGAIKKKVLDEFSSTPQEIEREMGKLLKDLKEMKALL